MKEIQKNKQKRKTLRARKTRARVRGTNERPRLCVFRSLKHLSVQVIDDDASKTLFSASDLEVKEAKRPLEKAKAVGLLIAQKAKEAKIDTVVFDRGAYRYHGRVEAVAQGAREGGLIL